MARLTTKAPAAVKKTAAKPAAAAKPVKHAAAPRAAATKAAAPKAAAAKRPSAGATKTSFTAEERYRMIAEAAYYRAERHGFSGDPVRDWIEAEHDIEMILGGKKSR